MSGGAGTSTPANTRERKAPSTLRSLLSRRTFAVGRLTRRSAEIRLIEAGQAAVAGPFLLRAVVRGAPSDGSAETVH